MLNFLLLLPVLVIGAIIVAFFGPLVGGIVAGIVVYTFVSELL